MKYTMTIFLAFFLAGCATPYQRDTFRGGYSEMQFGENLFQVSFRGNTYISQERATDYSLLRSAEVALENGFNYFIIVDAKQYTKTSSYTTPETTHTRGSASIIGNSVSSSSTSWTTGGETYHYSKPSAVNTIVCFRNMPEGEGIIYDAALVVRSVRDKYQITEDRNSLPKPALKNENQHTFKGVIHATPYIDPPEVIKQLKQLKELRDSGLLTEEEYESKRKALAEQL